MLHLIKESGYLKPHCRAYKPCRPCRRRGCSRPAATPRSTLLLTPGAVLSPVLPLSPLPAPLPAPLLPCSPALLCCLLSSLCLPSCCLPSLLPCSPAYTCTCAARVHDGSGYPTGCITLRCDVNCPPALPTPHGPAAEPNTRTPFRSAAGQRTTAEPRTLEYLQLQ